MSEPITILDGGMGREIKARCPSFDPILWSATALRDDEQLVVDIHKDFISAGASIITTNNYTVVPYVLKQVGLENKFESFTKLASRLARQAADEMKGEIAVAGALPPLFGTYRPEDRPSPSKMLEDYLKIIEWLEPNIDLLLAESITSTQHAQVICEATKSLKVPKWLACILDDSHPNQLLSGEPLDDVLELLQDYQIDALLFNCCDPRTITSALKLLKFKGQVGGYANAFTKIPQDWEHGKFRQTDEKLTPEKYRKYVEQWIQNGATIVGGCCGIGPEYTQEISRSLSGEYCVDNPRY